MIGSISFLFLNQVPENQQIMPESMENAYLGKIAIIIFTVLGTGFFLILQCIWYRKFFRKLARVNRDIKLDIDLKDNQGLLRNFNIGHSLSTIRKYTFHI